MINNRREDLVFAFDLQVGREFIECLKTNKIEKAINILKNNPDWLHWKYVVAIRHGGAIEVNVLHVAIIFQNMELIEHIATKEDADFKELDKSVLEVSEQGHKRKMMFDLFVDDDWIYGATPIHLASRFCHKSLPLLISKNRKAINDQSNKNEFSPLHITSIAEHHIGTRYEYLLN